MSELGIGFIDENGGGPGVRLRRNGELFLRNRELLS